jgi:hypothetical protein
MTEKNETVYQTHDRQKLSGFVTDAEMFRLLNIPQKDGAAAVVVLEKRGIGNLAFPRKDPLFGNRRYMPAVQLWFNKRYGLDEGGGGPYVPDGVENFSGEAMRSRHRVRRAL